jgi:hypothetical protein
MEGFQSPQNCVKSLSNLPLLLLLLVVLQFWGCMDPTLNKALQKCKSESQQMINTRFNTNEDAYSREVVTEYWQKGGWDGLPVSERKDLMSDTEDTAEQHYQSVQESVLFEFMAENGFVVSRHYPYRPYRWQVEKNIATEDIVKIPTPVDCLINRECDPGFECERQVCISVRSNAVSTTNGKEKWGCSKDTDCKGDRICEQGHCINPTKNEGTDNVQ